MKKPKGFFTYFQHAEVIGEFSDDEAGKLFKALLRYSMTGESPDFDGDKTLRIVFRMLKADIDENFERYRTVCENRRRAAIEREQRRLPEQEADFLRERHNCDNCD